MSHLRTCFGKASPSQPLTVLRYFLYLMNLFSPMCAVQKSHWPSHKMGCNRDAAALARKEIEEAPVKESDVYHVSTAQPHTASRSPTAVLHGPLALRMGD